MHRHRAVRGFLAGGPQDAAADARANARHDDSGADGRADDDHDDDNVVDDNDVAAVVVVDERARIDTTCIVVNRPR